MCDDIEVSVVIPVYNDPVGLDHLLKSLVDQNYPRKNYEIIVVDNKSDDHTPKIAQKYVDEYPDLVCLFHEKIIQSSYATRNKGIKQSEGEIIAFIDADCQADKNWLATGVEIIKRNEGELVGGEVAFTFSTPRSAAEIYDSTLSMPIKELITEQGRTVTANLFVQRDVFDTIGLFKDDLKSGGDVQWTAKATGQGFNLVYEPEAIVYHPARQLRSLLHKKSRIGWGDSQRKNISDQFWPFVRNILPPNPWRIKRKLKLNYNGNFSLVTILSVWITAWLAKWAKNHGRIKYYMQN